MGPFNPGDGTIRVLDSGPFVHRTMWWAVGARLLLLAAVLVLIGVAIWAIIKLVNHRTAVAAAAGSPSMPARDPALEELRLRYSRGELNRDEYLQRALDLGDREVRPPAPPTTPEPPAAPPPSED